LNPSDAFNGHSALGPLARNDGEPVFDEGWQAQVLGLALNLVDQGHFTAAQWSDTLGAHLASAAERGDPDNSGTYYQAVLSALEELLHEQQRVPSDQLEERTEAWRAAYLSTPHGQPVELR